MGWKKDAGRMARELKNKVKTVPFPVMKLAYLGLLKQCEEKPQSLSYTDTLIIRQLLAFWSDGIKQMRNHPEPTPELQVLQDYDCRMLLDIGSRMIFEVVEPIRQRKNADIKTDSIKDMIKLLDE